MQDFDQAACPLRIPNRVSQNTGSVSKRYSKRNMGQNLRCPGALILTHTQLTIKWGLPSGWHLILRSFEQLLAQTVQTRSGASILEHTRMPICPLLIQMLACVLASPRCPTIHCGIPSFFSSLVVSVRSHGMDQDLLACHV